MSSTVTRRATPRAPSIRNTTLVAGSVVALALVVAVAFRNASPPSPLLVGAGAAAALALAALAVLRYDAAVTLGFVLLAFVRFQPAPTDAVFGLVIVVAVLSGRFHPSRVPPLIVVLLSALAALNLVSIVASSESLRTAGSFFGITLYMFLFAVWLTSHVDGRGAARQVLIGYLLAALISAALGVLAIVAAIPGRSSLLLDGRAEALFKDPNVFGPFLVPACLLLIEEVVTPRLLPGRRFWKVAGVLLLALGVLWSYSRGAWLNLGVGVIVMLVVLLLRRGNARTTARVLGLLFVAVIVGSATVAITGSGSFLAERAALQPYDTGRFSAQQAGIQLGIHHLFGIGPGQFDVIEPLASHSLYVRVFAEQGPLGLLVLIALLLATLAMAGRSALRGSDTYGIGSAALLGAWCGLLVNSAVVDTLHWRHLWLIAALIWAGALRPIRAGPGGAHPLSVMRSRRPQARH